MHRPPSSFYPPSPAQLLADPPERFLTSVDDMNEVFWKQSQVRSYPGVLVVCWMCGGVLDVMQKKSQAAGQ